MFAWKIFYLIGTNGRNYFAKYFIRFYTIIGLEKKNACIHKILKSGVLVLMFIDSFKFLGAHFLAGKNNISQTVV